MNPFSNQNKAPQNPQQGRGATKQSDIDAYLAHNDAEFDKSLKDKTNKYNKLKDDYISLQAELKNILALIKLLD